MDRPSINYALRGDQSTVRRRLQFVNGMSKSSSLWWLPFSVTGQPFRCPRKNRACVQLRVLGPAQIPKFPSQEGTLPPLAEDQAE